MNSTELKAALSKLGWSQAKLAETVGMHPNSISKMVTADKVSKPVAAYIDVQLRIRELVS